jgi:hypothetical protein
VKSGRTVLLLPALCLLAVIGASLPSAGSFPFLFGVEIGMDAEKVREHMSAGSGDTEFVETGDGFCVALEGHDLFRHASYHFDLDDRLVQIDLTIREVRGAEPILADLAARYDLRLSPERPVLRNGMSVDIEGGRVVIRHPEPVAVRTHARRGPTR